jgi:hypothetical protein
MRLVDQETERFKLYPEWRKQDLLRQYESGELREIAMRLPVIEYMIVLSDSEEPKEE